MRRRWDFPRILPMTLEADAKGISSRVRKQALWDSVAFLELHYPSTQIPTCSVLLRQLSSFAQVHLCEPVLEPQPRLLRNAPVELLDGDAFEGTRACAFLRG
ncbi:hypothetical protein HPB49_013536 [Dermacentor silvarum]|uniref:Uncharacterized protein n=1 Tax=Dermacentor silvarum TaxID=543639 RepID=A0ACB8D5N8_DERSI|nr:hypothetical protein HPB49_013536 [Dermacentor silvarum]